MVIWQSSDRLKKKWFLSTPKPQRRRSLGTQRGQQELRCSSGGGEGRSCGQGRAEGVRGGRAGPSARAGAAGGTWLGGRHGGALAAQHVQGPGTGKRGSAAETPAPCEGPTGHPASWSAYPGPWLQSPRGRSRFG